MTKYRNYFFFGAIVLLSAGLVISLVSQNGSVFGFILSAIGIVILVSLVVFYLYHNKGFWGMRSTEASTNALVSTLALLLILGTINYLGFNYSYTVDLTENQLFTLSPQSQELVRNLSQPLKVYVFDSPPNPNDRTLLADYSRNSNLFEYEFVDPQVRIGLAQEFNVQRQGEVYVEFEGRRQLVQIVSAGNPLTEIELTNAIARVQRTEQPLVYIIQGHGEATVEEGENSFAQAVNGLTDKGYIVQPLNLATTPLIPPNANVVVVSSATRELLEGEQNAIARYVDNGGSLLAMYNANSPSSLDVIFADWGIVLHDGLIVDASGTGEIFGLGPSVTLAVDYGNHPITQDFGNDISIFPLARAILTQPTDNIAANPLVITSPQTWAESDITQETIEFDPEQDLPGPLNIAYALVRTNPDAQPPEDETIIIPETETPSPEEESTPLQGDLPEPPTINQPEVDPITTPMESSIPPETRMVVIGNSNFATNGWFSQQLNSDIWYNSIGWLTADDQTTLSISPKIPTNRRLNLQGFQAGLISWLALLIVPLSGLAAAIATWWYRSR